MIHHLSTAPSALQQCLVFPHSAAFPPSLASLLGPAFHTYMQVPWAGAPMGEPALAHGNGMTGVTLLRAACFLSESLKKALKKFPLRPPS